MYVGNELYKGDNYWWKTLKQFQIFIPALSTCPKQHILSKIYMSSTLVNVLPFEVHLKDSVGLHLPRMYVSMSSFSTSGRATSTNSAGIHNIYCHSGGGRSFRLRPHTQKWHYKSSPLKDNASSEISEHVSSMSILFENRKTMS